MFGKQKNKAAARKPAKVLEAAAPKSILSPKVAQADELRRAAEKAQKELLKLVHEWESKSSNEKSQEKRKVIDKEYGKKFKVIEKQEVEAYASYYSYVDKNFQKKIVGEAVKNALQNGGRGFMSKGFITSLEKAQKAPKKK